MPSPKIIERQTFEREQALNGHDILTDTGPTAAERYDALIPIGDATLTYTNMRDGQGIGPQDFPSGFYIPGFFKNVTVVGTVFAVKSDPLKVDI